MLRFEANDAILLLWLIKNQKSLVLEVLEVLEGEKNSLRN